MKHTPFEAPVVDHLSVRVVVDSHHELFLPKATHPMSTSSMSESLPGST